MVNDAAIESLFEKGWDGFHDAIVDALDISPSREQAIIIFKKLPDRFQEKAFKWGLDDSEVRDESFEEINDLVLSVADFEAQ